MTWAAVVFSSTVVVGAAVAVAEHKLHPYTRGWTERRKQERRHTEQRGGRRSGDPR